MELTREERLPRDCIVSMGIRHFCAGREPHIACVGGFRARQRVLGILEVRSDLKKVLVLRPGSGRYSTAALVVGLSSLRPWVRGATGKSRLRVEQAIGARPELDRAGERAR